MDTTRQDTIIHRYVDQTGYVFYNETLTHMITDSHDHNTSVP